MKITIETDRHKAEFFPDDEVIQHLEKDGECVIVFNHPKHATIFAIYTANYSVRRKEVR